MRILVTGASGLLGSKIAEVAVKKGEEVYSAYNTHKPEYGKPIRLDLTDALSCKAAFEEARPEAVIHSAALTNVDLCEREREVAWRVNVAGALEVARLCKELRSFLILVSTDYVFDGSRGGYSEDDEPNPVNYYGLTKLEAENKIKQILDEMSYCIARTSVIYGSKPAAGKVNFALWVLESLKRGMEVSVARDQVNSPTLNTNLANMILEIVERRLAGVYHLAGSTPISRYDFAKLLAEEFKLPKELIRSVTSDKLSWAARRPRDSSLNVSKAASMLRNKPMNIRESIAALRREFGEGNHG